MNTSAIPDNPIADAEKEALLASTQEFTLAEARATKALVAAGVANAGLYVHEAARMARLPCYAPHQQTSRALAALDTVVALHTRKWPQRWARIRSAAGEGYAGTVFDISLARLAKDMMRTVQIRVNGIDPDRLDEYARAMEAGDVFPAVVVFWNRSTNRVFLADGFHRYKAAVCVDDRYTIPAEVYAGTQQDAMEYAATCNATHGIPMTSADKRAAVGRLLTMHPDWSSREMARKVGCSHTFVDNIRTERGLSGNGCQIESERTVTRGDSTYSYTPPEQPDRERQKNEPGRIHFRPRRNLGSAQQEAGPDSPSSTPEVATLDELRQAFEVFLDSRFGTRGSRDNNLRERIEFLDDITSNDYQVPAGFGHGRPDVARTTWLKPTWISAVDNLRHRYRSQALMEKPPNPRVVNFPRATQDPLTLEPWQKIKRLLLDRRPSELRAVLGTTASLADFVNALDSIFFPPLRDRGERAAQTLLDVILAPWPGAEPEYAPPSAEASGDLACPDCGGNIELKHSDGDYILVCSDCGSVMEPAV